MVRVGIVGTSWWADSMYLPALTKQAQAEIVAVCGRNPESTQSFADRWRVKHAYTDWRAMIDAGDLDAVIVASPNDTHYPITMAALDAGLHVLCEKPLALTAENAYKMAEKAEAAGLVNMTPFTYRYMPTTRYVKRLIEKGFIGKPYHLNMRYYTGYGREAEYQWRFDASLAGAGVIGDLGSHWLYIARWIYGEIVEVQCYMETFIDRPNTPDGSDYPRAEDSAVLTVRFENGAYGVLQVTTVAWEGTKFGQTHHMEFHGAGGTLYNYIDWDTTQEVRGVKDGGHPQNMPVPDDIWQGIRRDTVHDTYRDIFREQNNMARGFIAAIAAGETSVKPNFRDGARVQRLIEAALESAESGCRVETPVEG